MSEYPSNPLRKQDDTVVEEEIVTKKVEKVISGDAKKRKRSGAQKFTDVFISEDISNVKDYILSEVLIPALKKAISDVVTKGVDILLYGESSQAKPKSISEKVSYRQFYDNDDRRIYSQQRSRAATGYGFEEVVLQTRGEAEEVLMRIDEIVDNYGVVSVADMYDLVGISPMYTDNKYGWTNVRNATIVRSRDGFVIKMPKALPID